MDIPPFVDISLILGCDLYHIFADIFIEAITHLLAQRFLVCLLSNFKRLPRLKNDLDQIAPKR
jgi:hypothetical protein